MMFRLDTKADELANLYRDAELHLRTLIAEAVASGQLGTASYRRRQLAAVQQILSQTQDHAVPEATATVVDGYRMGAELANKRIPAVELKAGFGGGVHQQAVELLADNLAARLNDAAVHVGRQVDDVFRREQLRHAARQLIEGATRREASAQLAQSLVDQGVTAFVDRAGRGWGLENYTRMAIRTVAREAATQGTKNRLLEHGLDLVTITAGGGQDDLCAPYAGNTYSLTGATSDYPVLDQEPPFHPNCTHVMTPAAENLQLANADLAGATA